MRTKGSRVWTGTALRIKTGSDDIYSNKAPNPNASKVFVNWVVSKEGSTVYANLSQDNSRRCDVPVTDPNLVPEKGRDYVTIDAEPLIDEILKTQTVAKEILG